MRLTASRLFMAATDSSVWPLTVFASTSAPLMNSDIEKWTPVASISALFGSRCLTTEICPKYDATPRPTKDSGENQSSGKLIADYIKRLVESSSQIPDARGTIAALSAILASWK